MHGPRTNLTETANTITMTTGGNRFLSGSVAGEDTMTSRLVEFLVDNNLLIGGLVRALRSAGVVNDHLAGRIQLLPDLLTKANCLLEVLLNSQASSLDDFFRTSDQTYHTVYDAIQASVNELRRTAVGKLSDCIRNPCCHWSAFYRHLHDCHLATDVSTIQFGGGLTLLHLVILANRDDLLRPIQYLGVWRRLRQERVPWSSSHQHRGKTPTDLASELDRRNTLEEIHAIDLEESTMSDLERHAQTGDEAGFRESVSRGDCFRENDCQRVLFYACQSGSLNTTMAVMEEERLRMFTRTSVDEEIKIAVRLGHAHLIKVLSRYVDVNLTSLQVDNKSLIERAITFGHWQVFDVLVKLKVPLPAYTLTLAASRGHATFIKNVLKFHNSVSINYKDRREKTALMFAVERDHRDVVQVLLDHDANMMISDCCRHNVLHTCGRNAGPETLDMLMSAARTRLQLRPLLQSRSKYLGQERCFLVRGMERSAPVWQYVEVDRGIISRFQAQVRSGAVTVREFGTVLKSGLGRDPPPEVVSEMRERCDVKNVSVDAEDDMLPVHVAIFKERETCALKLIELTPDVNQPDCFGLTPLHLACMRGNNKLVHALLARGADPTLTDLRGRTPAAIARLNNHDNITGLPLNQPINNAGVMWQTLQPIKQTDITNVPRQQSTSNAVRMTSSPRTSPSTSRDITDVLRHQSTRNAVCMTSSPRTSPSASRDITDVLRQQPIRNDVRMTSSPRTSPSTSRDITDVLRQQPTRNAVRMTSSSRTSPSASRKERKRSANEDIPSYAKRARVSLIEAYNNLGATRFREVSTSGHDPEEHTRETMRLLRDDIDRLIAGFSNTAFLEPH